MFLYVFLFIIANRVPNRKTKSMLVTFYLSYSCPSPKKNLLTLPPCHLCNILVGTLSRRTMLHKVCHQGGGNPGKYFWSSDGSKILRLFRQYRQIVYGGSKGAPGGGRPFVLQPPRNSPGNSEGRISLLETLGGMGSTGGRRWRKNSHGT